jgi:ABC-type Fe3+ transport system permease subunit
VSARIAEVTYLGEDLHLSLDLAGGERLRASVKNTYAASDWAPAQNVELVIDAADLRLLALNGRPMAHRGTRPVWAFLTGPYALLLLLLIVVPFANIAMYSLHPYSPTKVFLPELTFDNYRKIFDLYYVRLFGRTLQLGLITTAVCVVLGYPLTYCLARARPRWQAVGLFC